MKRFDGQIVKALREYVALEEARVMREMPLNSNFVEEVFARIDAADAHASGTVGELGAARRGRAPLRETGSSISSILGLDQILLHWRVVTPIAAVLAVIVGFLLFNSSDIDLRARSDQKLNGSASLPRNLRIKVHQDQIGIDLHEGADSMRGTFTKVPTNVPAGVWLFTGELRGAEGESKLARVHGNLWVTNATGRTEFKSAADIKSASLDATLELPNLVPVPVKMEFLPNP